MLNFLIDAVLQKFVKLLNFGFDLGDVAEFDFDGCRETVTAVVGQSELLAVVGAEFDSHDVVGWCGCSGMKKPTPFAGVGCWFAAVGCGDALCRF